MCVLKSDRWMGSNHVITDPLDLQMPVENIASQPKIICFISRVYEAREREQSFKGILYTIYKSEKENGKNMIISFNTFNTC